MLACNSVIGQAIGRKEEVVEQIFYDNILYYYVSATYENKILKIKLTTDVEGTNTPYYFYSRLNFPQNSFSIDNFKDLLKEVLYIRIVHDTFCTYQFMENVKVESGIVSEKKQDDPFTGENYVWASIRRTDNQEIQIIKDKF